MKHPGLLTGIVMTQQTTFNATLMVEIAVYPLLTHNIVKTVIALVGANMVRNMWEMVIVMMSQIIKIATMMVEIVVKSIDGLVMDTAMMQQIMVCVNLMVVIAV